jgi:ElaB/YqjD/DUF883 family membrane-anchored ribosome-binding protein
MFTSAPRNDAEATTRKVVDDASEGARRVKGDVREAANAVREDLNDLARQAGGYVREFADQTEENLLGRIRDNPVQSTLIAAGVGFVLGFLFRR